MRTEKYNLKLGNRFLIALDIADVGRRGRVIEKLMQLGASEIFNLLYSIDINSDEIQVAIERITDQLSKYIKCGDSVFFINAEGDNLKGTFFISRDDEAGSGIKVI